MTDDQGVTRAERMAIMQVCGNVSEEEAQRYCDKYPEKYGIRNVTEKQMNLITSNYS